jgi:hypothetical protein
MSENVLLIAIVSAAAAMIFYAGWCSHRWHIRRAVMRYQRYVDQIQQKVLERVVDVEITQHDGQYFVHNKRTGEFLAQGSTHQQISDKLRQAFPDIVFVASPDNIKDVNYPYDVI